MSGRSPIPVSISELDQQAFFDRLWKRQRGQVADLSASATLAEVITKINEILQADRNSGQQES